MMSSGSSSSGSGRNQIQYCNRPSPFTATQFEELENQALIFKYFVSGVPVPPHLLYTVRPPILQPTMGWGCFQIGFGNKKADPEPGRCRRTDGKKWRCSKEAYADSKYCEKHMHRGKNRSKNKSLNLDVATSAKLSSPMPTQDYTSAYSSDGGFYQSNNNNNSLYPFLSSSHHSSIAVTPTSAFSGENKDTHHLLLGSSSSRYWGGMKEETGERTEAAYETYEPPLTMSTQTEYSQLQQHYQYTTDPNNNNLKNPFHHFFGEWPVKNKNPDSSQDEASATPQLSISIPPHSF